MPTVAKLVFDELHVASAVRSWIAPPVNVPEAVNCWVVPTAMVGVGGVSAMDDTVATVRLAEPDTPKVAVMVGDPRATAVASPVLLIVATPVSDELQATYAVKFWVALFEKVPVAVNCCVVPSAIVGLDGVTAMNATVSTVKLVDPDMLPEVAVMVVDPRAPAVASPVVLMLAIPVADELHVTDAVKSFIKLFEYVPMALSC